MAAYGIRRVLQAALVLLAMSAVVFVAVYGIGNPEQILVDPQLPRSERERAIMALMLEQPSWMQYARFVASAVHGDIGQSFVHNRPAFALVLERLPATLELAGAAGLVAIVLGLPIGLCAGIKPRSLFARAVTIASLLGVSIPTFWAGVILILIFSGTLGWLPPSGRGPTTLLAGVPVSFMSIEGCRHLIMPAASLALGTLALVTRLARSGTRHALAQDYVRFARAKGISDVRIVAVHLLRNILGPVTMLTGFEFASLMVFAMVTEAVFAWPGAGTLLIDSIKAADGPVVVAYVMTVVPLFVVLNFIVDVAASAFDPRTRIAGRGVEVGANGPDHLIIAHDGR